MGKYIHELAEDEGGGRISSRVNEDLKGTNEIFANTGCGWMRLSSWIVSQWE